MKIPFRSLSAPLIAAAVTAALCAALSLPLGGERSTKTTYSPLANAVAAFAPPRPPASAPAPEPPPALASIKKASHPPRPRRKPAPFAPVEPPAPPESPDKRSDAASPLEGLPQPPLPAAAPETPAEYTADAVRDAYEKEMSKFPLDAKVSSERVLLRLDGLCRWRGHYIVKVAIGNQTDADFFIMELSAYEGREVVTVKSHFRLLVEPGRTREGHVLFDARPGAQVKVVLKEDRENGRVVELPVRYPF